jgi:hypothetical protein
MPLEHCQLRVNIDGLFFKIPMRVQHVPWMDKS